MCAWVPWVCVGAPWECVGVPCECVGVPWVCAWVPRVPTLVVVVVCAPTQTCLLEDHLPLALEGGEAVTTLLSVLQHIIGSSQWLGFTLMCCT